MIKILKGHSPYPPTHRVPMALRKVVFKTMSRGAAESRQEFEQGKTTIIGGAPLLPPPRSNSQN